MCFTEEDLRYTLGQLVTVLEYRKSVFKALGCPNIDAYNETTEQPLPRLIFACDEVAEMLDKTGAAEQIPKDARGRFITGDGTVFQGYLFDEGQL